MRLTFDGTTNRRRWVGVILATSIPWLLMLGCMAWLYGWFEFASEPPPPDVSEYPEYPDLKKGDWDEDGEDGEFASVDRWSGWAITLCFLLGTPLVSALSFRKIWNALVDRDTVDLIFVFGCALQFATLVQFLFTVPVLVLAAIMLHPALLLYTFYPIGSLWALVTLPLCLICSTVFALTGMKRLPAQSAA